MKPAAGADYSATMDPKLEEWSQGLAQKGATRLEAHHITRDGGEFLQGSDGLDPAPLWSACLADAELRPGKQSYVLLAFRPDTARHVDRFTCKIDGAFEGESLGLARAASKGVEQGNRVTQLLIDENRQLRADYGKLAREIVADCRAEKQLLSKMWHEAEKTRLEGLAMLEEASSLRLERDKQAQDEKEAARRMSFLESKLDPLISGLMARLLPSPATQHDALEALIRGFAGLPEADQRTVIATLAKDPALLMAFEGALGPTLEKAQKREQELKERTEGLNGKGKS